MPQITSQFANNTSGIITKLNKNASRSKNRVGKDPDHGTQKLEGLGAKLTRNSQREQACLAPKSSVTSSTTGLSLAVNKVEFERQIKASFPQNWKRELLIWETSRTSQTMARVFSVAPRMYLTSSGLDSDLEQPTKERKLHKKVTFRVFFLWTDFF